MTNQTPRLSLPYIAPAQAQKHVTHNEAIRQLDQIVQLVLVAVEALDPPALAEQGDVYALGDAPTGAWDGQGGALAIREVDGWAFVTPAPGWLASLRDSPQVLRFGDAGWAPVSNGDGMLEGLGIGAAWDSVNRLSVASDAALFSHAGAGHQLKLNKAADTDTASLLFQSNWTGHAEIGLAGETALSFKASGADAVWYQAMRIDPDAKDITLSPAGTPRITLDDTALNVDVPINGTAVQSTPMDDRNDVMLHTGAFGLGATDQSSTRFSDGKLDLPSGFYSGSGASADVSTFPDSGARYAPFLNLTRRNSPNDYRQIRLFFSALRMTVMNRPKLAEDWGDLHHLVSLQNLVGDVTQTNGAPTGAVIERGANADGSYVRFADGTQICWADFTLTGADVDTAFAGGFRSGDEGDVVFPAAFSEDPIVQCVCANALTSDALSMGYNGATGLSFKPRIWRATAGVADFAGAYVATGRWF